MNNHSYKKNFAIQCLEYKWMNTSSFSFLYHSYEISQEVQISAIFGWKTNLMTYHFFACIFVNDIV